MTRRSRRASSAPRTVGSEEGLTTSRPHPDTAPGSGSGGDVPQRPASGVTPEQPGAGEPAGESPAGDESAGDESAPKGGGRHAHRTVDQSKDDTDEGWGERGDDDASARWLKENRPPHWS